MSNKDINDRESRARKRKASENSNVVPSNRLKVKVVNDNNVSDNIQELKSLRNVKRFQVKRKKKRGGKKK